MPVILVETAFISNLSDAKLLINRKKDFAMVIASEITRYLGVSSNPTRTINFGIANKLGFAPYNLQANVNVSHSETLYKNKDVEITLGAELIQDEPALPISTANTILMSNMDDPRKIFEGATGVLLDMLPSAVTEELTIMFRGVEKLKLSAGKVSFNIFTQELKMLVN